jgi:hypothetical protein
MALTAIAIPFCKSAVALELLVLLGCFSVMPNVAPQMPLEHAILADNVRSDERTFWFSVYNTVSVAAISLGSLW